MDRPNQADVEKLSLEFAKEMIDFSDNGGNAIIDEDLIERSTNMAIDWLEGKEQRSKILEQKCAKWFKLSEINIAFLNLEENKKYWVIGRQYNSPATEPFKLFKGVLTKVIHSSGDQAPYADVQDENGEDYMAHYMIPESAAGMFNDNFKPFPPNNVNVKNNKFSPTMSSQS